MKIHMYPSLTNGLFWSNLEDYFMYGMEYFSTEFFLESNKNILIHLRIYHLVPKCSL
jgi:hypothetical protein